MNYWLMKSEPSTYSYEQLEKDKKTGWNGVRNFQASANLKAMKIGDRVFFYHSNEGLAVVGIAEVSKTYYPDPTDKTERFGMVDIKPVQPFKTPVALADIKKDPKLKDMVLVKNSRLSVQPVTPEEWKHICQLGGVKGEAPPLRPNPAALPPFRPDTTHPVRSLTGERHVRLCRSRRQYAHHPIPRTQMAGKVRQRVGGGQAGVVLHPAGADHAGAARHGRRGDRGARGHQAHGRGRDRRAMGADAIHWWAGAGGALRRLARAAQFRRRPEDHRRDALCSLHAGEAGHRRHDRRAEALQEHLRGAGLWRGCRDHRPVRGARFQPARRHADAHRLGPGQPGARPLRRARRQCRCAGGRGQRTADRGGRAALSSV